MRKVHMQSEYVANLSWCVYVPNMLWRIPR